MLNACPRTKLQEIWPVLTIQAINGMAAYLEYIYYRLIMTSKVETCSL
jgi:hypothetical protein